MKLQYFNASNNENITDASIMHMNLHTLNASYNEKYNRCRYNAYEFTYFICI